MDKLAGSFLGPYEIIAPLGAGGMGEVYRAKDPRLKREVAIKILTKEIVPDDARQKRFQREAQTASSLNHPNILVVYDIGIEDGRNYIVSELIDGEPLRKLIQKGPIPSRKFLDLAAQIADGLAAAHQAGIVHRDLKPENIMVTGEGRVKILDFGLAKLTGLESSAHEAETVSRPLTETGMIQGTVPYMSPEQASGAATDFRSDQFSFGSILYEMATGKRAFDRNTAAQTLSAIISEEPDPISTLNPKLPTPIGWLVERCMAKEARQRYDSTVDLYRDLRDHRDHLSETSATQSVVPLRQFSKIRRLGVSAFVTFLLLVTGFFLSQFFFNTTGPDFSNYSFMALASDEEYENNAIWSPDGKSIAYTKSGNVFVRNLTSPLPTQITRLKDGDCDNLFWSPDGSRIFYILFGNKLWDIGVAGGSPELCIEDVTMATISPDSKTIAFVRDGLKSSSLWFSSSNCKQLKKYAELPFAGIPFSQGVLHFSPDGSKIGIWTTLWKQAKSEFWLIPFPEGKPRKVLALLSDEGARAFSWCPDSTRIVFGRNSKGVPGSHLWMADTKNETLHPVTVTGGNEYTPSVSPDGEKIAFTLADSNSDIIEIPLDGSPVRKLLATARNEYSPSWSPTANQYLYVTDRNGQPEIWLKSPADGWERPLVTQKDFGIQRTFGFVNPSFSPDGQQVLYFRIGEKYSAFVSPVTGGSPLFVANGGPPTWSPDGNWIVFVTQSQDGTPVLAKTRVGSRSEPTILARAAFYLPSWSPDGNWIAYSTIEGLSLIHPDGEGELLLLKDRRPIVYGWSSDGALIYMMRLSTDGRLEVSSLNIQTRKEKILTDLGFLGAHSGYSGFSLSPDGKSFATSFAQEKGDIWILEGFDTKVGFRKRLTR